MQEEFREIEPATVTMLTQELRPATPTMQQIQDGLRVNDSDFGSRIESALLTHLKSLATEVTHKERLLTDLDSAISTRKRLLVTLQTQKNLPENVAFNAQIQARDKQISILSDRLFDAIAKNKPRNSEDFKTQNSVISALEAQISTLQTLISQLEENLTAAVSLKTAENESLHGEKEKLTLLYEGLMEEMEEMRVKMTQKDGVVKDARSDLQQLAKIVNEMTGLNKDLNAKIDKMNTEMEQLNSENFQNRTKIANVELLESQIQDLLKHKGMYEQQFEKMTRKERETEEQLSTVESVISQVKAHVQSLRELTSWEELTDTAKSTLQQLSTHMQTSLQSIQFPTRQTPENERKIAELKVKDKEQILQIEELKRKVASLESIQMIFKEKISQFESEILIKNEEINKVKHENENREMGFKMQIEQLKNEISRISDEKNKFEVTVSKSETQISLLLENIENEKNSVKNATQKTQLIDQQLKSVLSQLFQINSQLRDRDKTIYHQNGQISQFTLRNKIIEQELWSKDTQILTISSQISILEDKISILSNEIENNEAKTRKIVSEKIHEMQKLLEERDEELRILKGMVRSVQVQIKQKDVDLSRYKRKNGEITGFSPKKTNLGNKGMEEIGELVRNFVSQIERLKRFKLAKEESIEKAENDGRISPQWLKDELKLSKIPLESSQARELLRLSLEQRLSGLLTHLQTTYYQVQEHYGEGVETWAREVTAQMETGERGDWKGLVETCSQYGAKMLQLS